MSKPKALFIVEGKVAEKVLIGNLVSRMGELSSLSIQIVAVSANIHMLYQKLKKNDSFLNMIDALSEMEDISEEDRNILTNGDPFAYKYLVFDMDLQHYDVRNEDNIKKGFDEIEEMLAFFSNETDDERGKLYINYPMIESYRDCRSFFDADYVDKNIRIEMCADYKRIVGERGNNISIARYTHADLCDLICMNLYKMNWIINTIWGKMTYVRYKDAIRTNALFYKEKQAVVNNGIIMVMNSLLLFPVDYLGNKNGYYNNLRPR